MKAIWRILKYAKHLWPYYVAVSFASVVMALLNQAQPLLTKAAIDRLPSVVGGQDALTPVLVIVGAIIVSDILSTLIDNFAGYYGDIMSAKLRYFLSVRYFEHLLSLSQSYYANELTGKIINRLSRSITGVTEFLNIFANNFLQFLLTTVFTLIIVSRYSLVVAFLFAILYPIFLWLTGKTSVKWQVYQQDINEATDIASGRFAEVVSEVKVAKSYTSETSELNFFKRTLAKTIKITKPQSKLWHAQDIYRRLILNVIFGLVYAYIFWGAVDGQFTVGETVLLIQYGALIRLPIFSMSFLVDRTQKAIADSKEYFTAMNEVPTVTDKSGAKVLKLKSSHIAFSNVDFAYDARQQVLKQVSFTVQAGSKVALVGESGEGKTTISNLLLRLYDPTDGSIQIDGKDIADVTQKSLRQNIAVVFQDPTLFSGTVRENIAYGRPGAKQKDIEKAAKAANAWDFVKKLPDGLDTVVGERGMKLSGGQKQRIAIARAILKDAPILILDEATSSLDSKAEAEVQTALETLMKGRTTIIIAHRLSTIAGVDEIVTLKQGTVDEIGSPAELSQTDGIYAQLLELQNRTDESTKKKLKAYEI
ncbi:ABC transporter ATP-binding protein, partial [Candidatus Saccharibacteria bacterium]|nr:ABC transporter ATP-binding protein [Candidatus Saccharibacteria bacterium]